MSKMSAPAINRWTGSPSDTGTSEEADIPLLYSLRDDPVQSVLETLEVGADLSEHQLVRF